MATPPRTSPEQQGDAESMRQAVAAQTSVASSIACLLKGIAALLSNAVEKAEPDKVQALADSIDADPKAWSDAVLANTPSAVLSGETLSGLSQHVQQAFNDHAAHEAEVKAKEAAQASHASAQAQPRQGAATPAR